MGLIWRSIFGLLGFAIVFFVLIQPISEDWWLRHRLLSALDNPAGVRVVEHSNASDGPHNPNYKEIVYAMATLSPDQIEFLRKAFPLAWDYNDGSFSKCIFDEHHLIQVTRQDGSTLSFHICFECGQMQLDDGKIRDLPKRWESSLKGFVTSIGLHPDGPWDK